MPVRLTIESSEACTDLATPVSIGKTLALDSVRETSTLWNGVPPELSSLVRMMVFLYSLMAAARGDLLLYRKGHLRPQEYRTAIEWMFIDPRSTLVKSFTSGQSNTKGKRSGLPRLRKAFSSAKTMDSIGLAGRS